MTRSIHSLTTLERSQIKGILCDLDDTLSENGRMVPEAFFALKKAQVHGLRVIIVTGRPAGWVDHLARMWPLDGVVGENGGLWFWHDGQKLQRRFLQTENERKINRKKLELLAKTIPESVLGCAISADQPYRELDLAIDFCEDVSPLDDTSINKIVNCFVEAGATCKVSSIHVNGWYGDFDKLIGCHRFMKDRWGENLDLDTWAYFGDSCNDEPMFKAFKYSIGVANVVKFFPRLEHKPKFITDKPCGHGFAEGISVILD